MNDPNTQAQNETMTERPLSEAEVRRIMTKRLDSLADMAETLKVIHDHRDLCREGQRAVNGIVDLTHDLIQAIETDDDVGHIADLVQQAVSKI